MWIDRRCQGHARASSALQAAAIRQERAWALTAFAGDDVCAAARTTARVGASRAAARAGVVEDKRLDEPLARRGQHETVEGGLVGLDVGPSTVAVYSEQGAGLVPLAPDAAAPAQ